MAEGSQPDKGDIVVAFDVGLVDGTSWRNEVRRDGSGFRAVLDGREQPTVYGSAEECVQGEPARRELPPDSEVEVTALDKSVAAAVGLLLTCPGDAWATVNGVNGHCSGTADEPGNGIPENPEEFADTPSGSWLSVSFKAPGFGSPGGSPAWSMTACRYGKSWQVWPTEGDPATFEAETVEEGLERLASGFVNADFSGVTTSIDAPDIPNELLEKAGLTAWWMNGMLRWGGPRDRIQLPPASPPEFVALTWPGGYGTADEASFGRITGIAARNHLPQDLMFLVLLQVADDLDRSGEDLQLLVAAEFSSDGFERSHTAPAVAMRLVDGTALCGIWTDNREVALGLARGFSAVVALAAQDLSLLAFADNDGHTATPVWAVTVGPLTEPVAALEALSDLGDKAANNSWTGGPPAWECPGARLRRSSE